MVVSTYQLFNRSIQRNVLNKKRTIYYSSSDCCRPFTLMPGLVHSLFFIFFLISYSFICSVYPPRQSPAKKHPFFWKGSRVLKSFCIKKHRSATGSCVLIIACSIVRGLRLCLNRYATGLLPLEPAKSTVGPLYPAAT